MGVPKFYRWLSERFPLINQAISDATLLPEVDNLYLDLNGTIHNATHGDGASRKLEMKDVMMSIMTSIDHSVKLVRCRCGAAAQFSRRGTLATPRAAPSCVINAFAVLSRLLREGRCASPCSIVWRCWTARASRTNAASIARPGNGAGPSAGSHRFLCRGFTASAHSRYSVLTHRVAGASRLFFGPALRDWCGVHVELCQGCPLQLLVGSDGCYCHCLC
jgi:hypothetical protein